MIDVIEVNLERLRVALEKRVMKRNLHKGRRLVPKEVSAPIKTDLKPVALGINDALAVPNLSATEVPISMIDNEPDFKNPEANMVPTTATALESKSTVLIRYDLSKVVHQIVIWLSRVSRKGE